ncbi:MAG TPA: hypothetical protein VMS65_15600 [Polyangiaceae bacterium]|nr:hypothetical protein [Polyangiaceae bacterium]
MVSQPDRERARRVAALTAAVAVALLAGGVANGCSRSQNLIDEPDSGSGVTMTPVCDGGIPEVADSGIASEELVACAERPLGACQGSNDFPCEFESWFRDVVSVCQNQADCRAGGCVEAQMGADGCVRSVHMTEPDPIFVACLVESFGAYRCPCGETFARQYLGVANTGCHRPCGTGEEICPSGELCIEGICRPGDAGDGG